MDRGNPDGIHLRKQPPLQEFDSLYWSRVVFGATMSILLHETLIPHSHPHLDTLMILAVLAGLIMTGWMLYRSRSQA